MLQTIMSPFESVHREIVCKIVLSKGKTEHGMHLKVSLACVWL